MVYLVIPLLLSFHFTLFFHLLLCAEQSIHPKAVTAYVMLIISHTESMVVSLLTPIGL
jgi:hypothetical protein